RGLDRQRLQAENIRLREALSLYRVSEAIAASLDLDRILDVILESVMEEVHADVVTLHLADTKTGAYEERCRRGGEGGRGAADTSVGALDIPELLAHYAADKPVVSHGIQAARYFAQGAGGKRLVSFASVPMKIRDRIIGMLNACSFTRGKKFDEGQRKMLVILAGRAAMSIENARLYEDLVDKNRDLQEMNMSLEENFRQTIVGFAHALEESDRYTRGHSERVAFYARLIAMGMQLKETEIELVVQAGLMHDIGKIRIPHEKLNKPRSEEHTPEPQSPTKLRSP